MRHQYGSTWRIHDTPFPGVKRCVLQMTPALLLHTVKIAPHRKRKKNWRYFNILNVSNFFTMGCWISVYTREDSVVLALLLEYYTENESSRKYLPLGHQYSALRTNVYLLRRQLLRWQILNLTPTQTLNPYTTLNKKPNDNPCSNSLLPEIYHRRSECRITLLIEPCNQ